MYVVCFLLGDSPASSTRTYLPMKMEQSVPKRRHINFRRLGITQKKAYSIQHMAKVWNQHLNVCCMLSFGWTPASSTRTYLPMKMEQNVPNRRHINFRRLGITQKKAYSIQYMAKIWNQHLNVCLTSYMPINNAWFSGPKSKFSGNIQKMYVETNRGTGNCVETNNAVCTVVLSGGEREKERERERDRLGRLWMDDNN